jgi:hypothetical protein
MLKINKGEPWIMWPDSMVKSFIEFPANRIMDYNGDFEISMEFELNEEVKQKGSLFTKLPTYCGFDIESWGGMFILTDENNKMNYLQFDYVWEPNKQYNLRIVKTSNVIELIINHEVLIRHEMSCKLGSDSNSHIIFGCGNYPLNNFNLNYVGYTIHNLKITKDDNTICEHDFKKFIHNKAVDITGNCNFIHKY